MIRYIYNTLIIAICSGSCNCHDSWFPFVSRKKNPRIKVSWTSKHFFFFFPSIKTKLIMERYKIFFSLTDNLSEANSQKEVIFFCFFPSTPHELQFYRLGRINNNEIRNPWFLWIYQWTLLLYRIPDTCGCIGVGNFCC